MYPHLSEMKGDSMLELVTSKAENANAAPLDVPPQEGTASKSIEVRLTLKIDLLRLRRQKRAMIGVHQDAQISADQEDAAEGMLNLIDHIQDSILEQGLASEEDIFPQMCFPFASAA
jgi:hypothetical protein